MKTSLDVTKAANLSLHLNSVNVTCFPRPCNKRKSNTVDTVKLVIMNLKSVDLRHVSTSTAANMLVTQRKYDELLQSND